jgi:hypothetical protein
MVTNVTPVISCFCSTYHIVKKRQSRNTLISEVFVFVIRYILATFVGYTYANNLLPNAHNAQSTLKFYLLYDQRFLPKICKSMYISLLFASPKVFIQSKICS